MTGILIIGALGKTGRHLATSLHAAGYPVRAFVRSMDIRARQLTRKGILVTAGDLHDPTSLTHALQGMDQVYFCYPEQGPDLTSAARALIEAAETTQVKRIIHLSCTSAHKDSKSRICRGHAMAEQLFDASRFETIHLKPTIFMDFFYHYTHVNLSHSGRLLLPFGQTITAPIASCDVARVAEAYILGTALTSPRSPVLTGSQSLDPDTMADRLSYLFERPVTYLPISLLTWQKLLQAEYQLTRSHITCLTALANAVRSGLLSTVTTDFERITGRHPMTFNQFALSYHAHFGFHAPSADWHTFSDEAS